MLDPLKKKFDEAGLSVYVHEDFDCTGLPNLEKQIIGAKLGVVIFRSRLCSSVRTTCNRISPIVGASSR